MSLAPRTPLAGYAVLDISFGDWAARTRSVPERGSLVLIGAVAFAIAQGRGRRHA